MRKFPDYWGEKMNNEFGWTTRLVAPLVGRYIYGRLKREENRLAAGRSYEPSSFCEKNAAALALKNAAAERSVGHRGIFSGTEPVYQ